MDLNTVRERTAAVERGTATFLTGATNPPPPRPRWLRRGGFDVVEVIDVIIALICFGTSNSWLTSQQAPVPLLFAFITCAPLALRTRLPLTAWSASALSIVAMALFSLHTVHSPAALIVYGLCLYAVTVRCAPRIIVTAAVVTAVAAIIISPRDSVAALFLAAIPLLTGAVVRTRRSGKRQLAEQERRHSGERALLEERQRIARELHDVVAHHMSVIAIQAEAAKYKTADPPPELVESFGDIRASALTGLTELRRLLGVLRTGTPDTAPQPGLADLDALLDSARGGGVAVTADVKGEPVPLPEGVDLSAYRILQEALSNAMRHAPGSRIDVQVDYRVDGFLELEVRDVGGTGPDPDDPGPESEEPEGIRADAAGRAMTDGRGMTGGHGIIGMRERAAMLGGTLFAGPDGGGFRVTAFLPTSAGHEADREEEPA